uniref:Putative secreted protein n=1 Tax=Anopheles darlingi TaxID=43151 RepID=A0A2M4D629_ANODA
MSVYFRLAHLFMLAEHKRVMCAQQDCLSRDGVVSGGADLLGVDSENKGIQSLLTPHTHTHGHTDRNPIPGSRGRTS